MSEPARRDACGTDPTRIASVSSILGQRDNDDALTHTQTLIDQSRAVSRHQNLQRSGPTRLETAVPHH